MPSQKNLYEQLRKSRYFEFLSDDLLKDLVALAPFKNFKEGGKNQELFCVVDGSTVVEMDEEPFYMMEQDVFRNNPLQKEKQPPPPLRNSPNVEKIDLLQEPLSDLQENSLPRLHYALSKWFSRILADQLKLAVQKSKHHEKINQRLAQLNRQMELELKITEDELNIAAQTQQAVLSKKVQVPHLISAVRSFPWGKVSGDMCYESLDKEGAFTFFIGDATGHGIPAAFITMMTTMGLNSIDPTTPTDDVIRQLNSLLASCTPANKFMTGIFMRITLEGWMTLTNAGHPPLIILPANSKEVIVKKERGMGLGMFAEEIVPYSKISYSLKSGDKFFFYTDGITEYTRPDGELFQEFRLTEFLRENRELDLEDILNKLLQTLIEFSQEREPEDDVTIIGFQMK